MALEPYSSHTHMYYRTVLQAFLHEHQLLDLSASSAEVVVALFASMIKLVDGVM